MVRVIKSLQRGGMLVGSLPKGCQLCTRGSKLVLFVTGLCTSSCFYCPVSERKIGRDLIFADELPVSTDDDVLYEAEAIGAEGAGMSGGDPLCRLERTEHFIRLLKERNGKEFHIHLYTSQSDADESVMRRLKEAGLDEIRFHPQCSDWSAIEAAVRLGMSVGLELPVIPGRIDSLIEAASRAEQMGLSFMNINELEASETNFARMTERGMRLASMDSASIEGSARDARSLLEWATTGLRRLTVHYCSAGFKDSVQMRNRLQRRMERTRREFEVADDTEPLLVLGVVRAPHGKSLSEEELSTISRVLTEGLQVPREMINIDQIRSRLEIAPWILEEVAEDLRHALPGPMNIEIGIAQEYPTWDRFQTLFEPL
ncbi:MAG: radical SAM protein [Candidatus Thorarchaeota archaeon]|nr:radical SAM protein [Candidatus Thorarchaeota archaeon]